MNRRRFLELAAISSPFLAGCSSEPQEGTTAIESTPTVSESPPPSPEPTTSAELLIEGLNIRESELDIGESLEINLIISNEGEAAGDFELILRVADQIVTTRTVQLSGGERTEVELSGTIQSHGTQELFLNNESVGEVVVHPDSPVTVRDVCGHYYTWYGAPAHDHRGGEWSLESPSTPILGNYTSTDYHVIEQHIDWCHAAGISWLNATWWGPGTHTDNRLKNEVLPHPRASELDWSILYEKPGRFGDGLVDLGNLTNRGILIEDLDYLASTYFDRDHYKHIDGRPVWYLYSAAAFDGDVIGAFEEAFETVGVRPFIIADINMTSAPDSRPISDVADAVTTYGAYKSVGNIDEVYEERIERAYRDWYLVDPYVDVEIWPTAQPGFDDTEITHVPRDNPPAPRSPERYRRVAEATRDLSKGPVFVTSFNEWYEDTQIEPGEEYGETYLDITSEVLATGERSPPDLDGDLLVLEFDHTVPESELNPDVEHSRDLTLLVNHLTIKDDQRNVVIDVDVGGAEEGISFLKGAYHKGGHGDSTWRWLGGDVETLIFVPSKELPEGGTLVIRGRGADRMTMKVIIGQETQATTTLSTDSKTYTIDF